MLLGRSMRDGCSDIKLSAARATASSAGMLSIQPYSAAHDVYLPCYYKHACPIPLYTPQTLNRHNLKLQAWHNPALNSNIMILHGGSVQSLATNEAF